MTPVYLHLSPGDAPPSFVKRPFQAVLIADEQATDNWRNQIANWLLDGGCLYFIAWGKDSDSWHDTVDWVNLEAYDYGDIPDDRFVMTTWHDKEPLSEALWFAGNCASHPDVELQSSLILHVAEEAQRDRILKAYNEAQEMPAA